MKVVSIEKTVRPEILDPDTTLIRISEVMAKTGLARSTVYKKIKSDPTFPKPVKMSRDNSRTAPVHFVLGEVQAWVRQQIAARDRQDN